MTPVGRTVLHGQCLVGGRHPSDSKFWAECPLNPEVQKRRSEARRKAARTRWGAPGGGRLHRTIPPRIGNQADTYNPEESNG